jgi:homoserine kinase
MAKVRVPASTSNLGPGFDTLGLALRLYLEVEAEVREEGVDDCACVAAEGEGAAGLPRSRENMICRAFHLAAAREGVKPPPVFFRVRNEIPVTRGLGSSAAAAVAGISAFEAVTGHAIPLDRLFAYGLEMEGHCDNFGASVLGGLVTACSVEGRPPLVVRRDWPEELRAVLVIPNVHLRTSAARGILPQSVPRKDAIFDVQRVSLFHAAIAERRYDLLGEAMRDALHQPYRESLLPGLREVFALEPDDKMLGVALSGAGSAVIALATGDFDAVAARVERCFAEHGVETETLVLGIDPDGRRVMGERASETGA